MSTSVNISCSSLKKRTHNYSTNNAYLNMMTSIGILVNTSKTTCLNNVSITLNPFKSYPGSISGFGMAIKNKF